MFNNFMYTPWRNINPFALCIKHFSFLKKLCEVSGSMESECIPHS